MKRYLSAGLAALAALSLSVFAKDEIARTAAKSNPTKSKEAVTAPVKAKSPAKTTSKIDKKSVSLDMGERPQRELNVAEANRMAALAAAAGEGPVYLQAVASGVSPELSRLAPIDPARLTRSRFFPKTKDGGGKGRPARDIDGDDERIKNYNPFATIGADAALQSWRAPLVMPAPIGSFEGLLFSDNGGPLFTPPDPNGAVGPNHYVQTINITARVFNKATGVPMTPAFFQSSLFAALPGSPCGANDDGDPITQYDKLADRFVISQFLISVAPSHQCIAVSQTGDPTGSWFVYDFVLPGTVGATTEPYFHDYPHLGTWPDGYYMTTNQFNQAGTAFHSAGFFSFERSKMLVGNPTAGLLYFDTRKPPFVAAEGIGGALPSDFDGRTPPPAGSPNMFMYFTTPQFGDPALGMRIFAFHSDFTTPASSTVTELTTYAAPLPLAAFGVDTTGSRNLIPQPPPATAGVFLDAISDRLMHRLQYRNFGGFDSWVVAHNVDADTVTAGYQGGVRTYQIRRTPAGTGAFTVPEQSTFTNGNDGIARWMASAAMDGGGNLAVGYSASSLTVFPSLRYAGRLAGDPANSLAQGEQTLFAGLGSQVTSGGRWGDYSALTVDPVDDCTFWYTNEYYATNVSANWHTRIGSFRFPPANCAPTQGVLTGTITNCAGAAPIPGAVVTLNNGFSTTTNAAGVYTFPALPPAAYTFTVTKANFAAGAGGGTVNNGATTTVNVCLNGSPAVTPGATSIAAEACVPPNNGIDPGELVTVNFCVQNSGAAPSVALTGTLQNTGGVTLAGAPQNYGVVGVGATVCRPFVFTAAPGICGGGITATINFQDGALNLGPAVYNLVTGTLVPGGAFAENFDTAVVPALPANWTASNPIQVGGDTFWVTSAALPNTAPNHAFVDDPSHVTDKVLETPIMAAAAGASISFQKSFALETNFDGAVLEVSSPNINGGVYTDITAPAVGGSFGVGGYINTISSCCSNPLAARMAWTGSSAAYTPTTANLGPNVVGQNIRLRFRMGSDSSVAGTGFRVDTITSTGLTILNRTCCVGAGGGGGGGNNPTSTIISSSLNPSIVGQSVTFTARVVSQASGTPSGNVQFRDGATVLATVPLNLLGVATTTTSALTVGSHTITAFYFGDSNFLQSLSALLTQVVSPLPTTTTAVTSSKNPSNAGDSVTFTATVTSSGGTPTGSVAFFDGALSLGTGTLSGGKATLSTSTLAAGTHSITATYGGSSGFATSTSAALSQVVNAVGNSTTLTSSKNPSLVGDSVTFTATVTAAPPASGTPTGTVTFKDGSTTVGTGTLAAGKATLTTSALALGDHNMTAVYGGDAIFSTTTSATLVQRVTNNAGCTAAGNNLCVQNGRFTIGVAWQNQYAGTTGVGSPIAITADSGYFTFFSPNNIELLVKVLDGRSVNGNFWVLYGALSDVAYTITVTDTTTSTVKTYKNPAGTLASFSDTTAFPSARAAGAMTVTGEEYGQLAAIQWAETLAKGVEPKTSGRQALEAGACTTSGGTLCIQGARFSVSVAWKNYNDGTTGSGTAVSLASDSGSFWFFNSSNIELLVKVLDGRSVNGKFWFGYGALSDVEYTITVTDTTTGAVKTYNNPAHNLGSKLDLNAF